MQSSTELKVKQATDENESSGATGTLMNEISVLTYSPKTLKEITQVVKKRLTGYGRKSSHKNCIHIIKTLTLISYLVNNGSNDFISWARGNLFIIECLRIFEVQDPQDDKVAKQIQLISDDLCTVIKDDDLLEKRRKDVIQFRSSISSPGRKSTDNSHLKKWGVPNGTNSLERKNTPSKLREVSPTTINEYQFTSNVTQYYQRGITSLDLKRRLTKTTNGHSSLDPLKEEDSNGESNDAQIPRKSVFSSNNPFL